ncbi:MAG: ABC transporter ATP-binding protein [Actinomycetota bacterium]
MMDHRTVMGFRRDEEISRRRLDRAVLRRVFGYIRPYRGPLIAFIVTVVLASAATAVSPLLLKALLDTAIPDGDRGLVLTISLGALGLALANALLSLVQRYYSARIGEGLIFDLRTALYTHVQRMPLGFFTRTQTGALQSRLNSDVVGAQQAVTTTLGTVVQNFIQIVITLIVMVSLDWQITLLTLLALPAFIIPARRMGPRIQRVVREGMQLNAEMNTLTAERFNVAGALLVKLFGRAGREEREFAARAGRVRDVGIRSAMYTRVLLVTLGLVTAVGTAIVYLVGGNLAVSGSLEVGTVAAFVLYVQQLYQPLAQLTNSRVDVLSAMVSFERVFEVLDFPSIVTDRPDAVELRDPVGRVELDHVWFRHPPGRSVAIASLEAPGTPGADEPSDWILRDCSLRVAPGETVAIVGPSGAGKTTMASLVARLADVEEGAVRVDGHDVRDLTQDSLHDAIGIVPQDPHLFHDSIGANLRYARPDATDAELLDACEAARIRDLVESLPDGLATVVGERGYRMSGGEKQRLAIARLLLKNPRVVILDEATSHLDSESEAAIQRAFAGLLRDRTALVIAHRLSTIADADRIVVVADGRIVEAGTHSELLARGGAYADLQRSGTGPEPADDEGPEPV